MICAEPTLRYALKNLKGCDISLASEAPALFSHLEFKEVFDLKKCRPAYENYLCFETITPPNDTNLVWQFFSHLLTHCVDFSSMCALRSQLPIADREIVLRGVKPIDQSTLNSIQVNRPVYIHAGKHWPSKTFPKDWWDAVLLSVIEKGGTPILIGADTDDNRSTVDVSTRGCVDLRNKTSIMETVWLLQNASVLLTNDSSPLHMAASGDAWVGLVATCKHQDFIMHWRHGQWAWRMKAFNTGGMWDVIDHCPNKTETVEVDKVDPELLRSWLPRPVEFAEWAVSKT